MNSSSYFEARQRVRLRLLPRSSDEARPSTRDAGRRMIPRRRSYRRPTPIRSKPDSQPRHRLAFGAKSAALGAAQKSAITGNSVGVAAEGVSQAPDSECSELARALDRRLPRGDSELLVDRLRVGVNRVVREEEHVADISLR